LVAERGAVRAAEVAILAGARPDAAVARGAIPIDGWLIDPSLATAAADALADELARHHREHPLRPGLEMNDARWILLDRWAHLADAGLADALLGHLEREGRIARDGTAIRLPEHMPSTKGSEEADRLVAAVRAGEPGPPTVRELHAAGFGRELIEAICAEA